MSGVPNSILDAQDDFRALFENAPDLMYMHDLTGVLTRVNRAFERVTGYRREESIGRSFFDLVGSDAREEARERVFEHLGGSGPVPFPISIVNKCGEVVHLEVSTELVFRDGQPVGVQGYARDISPVVTFTRYLQLLHRLTTTNYPRIDLLFGDYLATGCEIFEVDAAAITKADGTVLKTFGDAQYDNRAEVVFGSRETIVQGREEEPRPVYVGTPILIGDTVYGAIGFWSLHSLPARKPHPQAREVVELMAKSIAAAVYQRQLTDQLAYQANHDALTGLPNRLMLQTELDRALSRAGRTGKSLALVFIDLDRFKQINDTLGHEIGDLVLQQVGHRLQNCMRPGDILARMGGDEFTAILTGCDTEEAAAGYARELMTSLRMPCRVNGRELFVTGSLGISLFPRDGLDAVTLLRNADSAMYTAKNRSKNELHFFTPASSEGASKRLELETCLRRALERHEFQMYYQPQVDLNGRLASLEALLVWDTPELGRVSPSEFIPIAEETGMILPIGEWVLGHACNQIAAWRASGLATVPLAVNVSALQFAQPGFVITVADALSRAGIPSGSLELELTESLIMQDVLASANRMRELRDIGVKIAIDDFGTGYSSLSYLRRLPADSLKIDQSFLQESEYGPATLALIKSIVVLAHNIGLSVTAEGIETAEQLQLIRLAGCDRAQGHLFGAGLPPHAAEELLRGR
jgi:diguanylate cyclase (GGDEF)-like protein/PAS domain S-box-containing protein